MAQNKRAGRLRVFQHVFAPHGTEMDSKDGFPKRVTTTQAVSVLSLILCSPFKVC